MKKLVFLLTAGAIAIAPAMTLAGPGGSHGGGMGAGAMMGQGGGMGRGASALGHGSSMGSNSMSRISHATTHTSQGPTNGKGWDHMNGPDHATGQPGAECEEIRPGHASSAPGSAFNPDGNAGTHYAGEQPQNSRNSSAVSQYDVACLNQERNH